MVVGSTRPTVGMSMPHPTRDRQPPVNLKAQKGLATRRHLVATATGLFAVQGYEATSIDNVLDAAGVSRGALYHHFPGKEALFEAVLEAVEEELATVVVAAAEASGDPRMSLQAGCLAWVQRLRDPVVRRIVLVHAPPVVGWEPWRWIAERPRFPRLALAPAQL